MLEADQSIIEYLNEAVTFQMPNELRRLFAIILVHCALADMRILWDTYSDTLCEDFKKETRATFETHIFKTLKSLSVFLESMGRNINAYDFPEIHIYSGILDHDYSREIQDEMSIEIPNEDRDAESKLNDNQRKAFELILKSNERGKGGIFFIDGPGRIRKTFLNRALLAHLKLKNLIALAFATSGVATRIMRRTDNINVSKYK